MIGTSLRGRTREQERRGQSRGSSAQCAPDSGPLGYPDAAGVSGAFRCLRRVVTPASRAVAAEQCLVDHRIVVLLRLDRADEARDQDDPDTVAVLPVDDASGTTRRSVCRSRARLAVEDRDARHLDRFSVRLRGSRAPSRRTRGPSRRRGPAPRRRRSSRRCPMPCLPRRRRRSASPSPRGRSASPSGLRRAAPSRVDARRGARRRQVAGTSASRSG